MQSTSASRRTRRWRGAVALGAALVLTGALYALLIPRPQVGNAESAMLERGRQLYADSCLSCHGRNLQGVPARGPSLIGVGQAAVHLQVSSGRMPLARQAQQARRKAPVPEFDPATPDGRRNLRALSAYVQAHGGGPELPEGHLVGEDTARGGALFRLNCASCHNFTGRGGALTGGKFAPLLDQATPDQVYAAMLSGPQAMPVFSDRQLTRGEKEDIIAYVLSVRDQHNTPGGANLGEMGPTTEGAAAFLIGMVALVGVTLWLGARA